MRTQTNHLEVAHKLHIHKLHMHMTKIAKTKKYLIRQIAGTTLDPCLEYVPGVLVSEPAPPFRQYWIFQLQSGRRIPVFSKEDFKPWA